MPYKVFKDGGRYCVYKHDADGQKTGDSLGCHDTRKAAMGQMRALYASEDDKDIDAKSLELYDQEAVAYTPLSATEGQACAACRWFRTYGGEYSAQDSCHIIQDWPDAIEPTGWCNRFEKRERPRYEPEPLAVYVVSEPDSKAQTPPAGGVSDSGEDAPVTRKSVRQMIADAIASFGQKTDDAASFKVIGDHWLLTYTNNFEDREGELFPTKAIDDFIDRVDNGIVAPPQLWVWHVGKQVRVGEATMVGRHEHFVVAAGGWDDTDLGQRAKAFYSQPRNMRQTAHSHGFTYDRSRFDGKQYHAFNTFEISLLPRGKEANRFTSLERIKEMPITDEKKKYLEKVFGPDVTAGLLSDLEERGKALEELGVEYKDFTHVDADDAHADKDVTNDVEHGLKELLLELVSGSGEAVNAALAAVKEVKALRTTVEAQQTTIDNLKAIAADKPRRASQSEDTELTPERLKELLENADKQNQQIDPFWGTTVTAEEA